MRTYGLVLATLLASASLLPAQERGKLFSKRRDCGPSPYAPMEACPPAPGMAVPGQPGTAQPGMPPTMEPGAQPPSSAFSEALASAPESGTQPGRSYMPGFFGDLIASCIGTPVFLPETQRFTSI